MNDKKTQLLSSEEAAKKNFTTDNVLYQFISIFDHSCWLKLPTAASLILAIETAIACD